MNQIQLQTEQIKKICIIANHTCLKRDYSDFVDSCDLVIRINKMDNLNSKLTGLRTDMVVIGCWKGYLNYSDAERNVDVLRKVPAVVFLPECIALSEWYCKYESIYNYTFIPVEIHQNTIRFTTTGKAIVFAHQLYSEAQIYLLGDTDVKTRTNGSWYHLSSEEDKEIGAMIETCIVIPILEESNNQDKYIYSKPILGDKEISYEKSMLWFNPKKIKHEIIKCSHPIWQDDVRITDKAACRKNRYDTASIEFYDGKSIILNWDRWDWERYVLDRNGIFQLDENG